jgi:hypothetical protein
MTKRQAGAQALIWSPDANAIYYAVGELQVLIMTAETIRKMIRLRCFKVILGRKVLACTRIFTRAINIKSP